MYYLICTTHSWYTLKIALLEQELRRTSKKEIKFNLLLFINNYIYQNYKIHQK